MQNSRQNYPKGQPDPDKQRPDKWRSTIQPLVCTRIIKTASTQGRTSELESVVVNSTYNALSTSPTQLFCLLNSHAFLFFFIIATLIRKYGCQTSVFGFSLNKEKLSRHYVNFTEPMRLRGRLNRLTNFGIASKHLHFVPCQYDNTAVISKSYLQQKYYI